MRGWVLATSVPCIVFAQEPIAPSDEASRVHREVGGYSVSNSVELGYRFAEVAGDHDLYRASVNYGNGIRIFNGNLRIDSIDGQGVVDGLSVRSRGGPGDPYQALSIQAEKDRRFRYQMQYQLNRYHNRLPMLWRGERGIQTDRLMQSHDLTLRQGTRFEVLLGFDHNRRVGPGFSSEGIADRFDGFDAANFLRFRTDLRQRNKQYRAGFTARFVGMALTAVHALDLYEEGGESADALGVQSLATNIQPVEDLRRREPFHGRTPVTTIALRTEADRPLGIAARYVYSGGHRNSTLLENLAIPNPAASASTYRDTFVVGDADRDQSSGDLTVAFAPTARWAITNTTAFHNTRIEGRAAFLETGLYRNEFTSFEHLGIRRLANATEVSFRPAKRLSVFGAHRYSTRRIRTREVLQFDDFGFGTELKSVDNGIKGGVAGVRWTPGAGLRASFDLEVGRADRPLTPTAPRRFHNHSGRVRWRRGGFSLSAVTRRRINSNPTELLSFSSRSRVHGVHSSWVLPDTGFVLDGGYTLLEMDVSAGILDLFDFGDSDRPDRGRSVYGSRIHSVQWGVRGSPYRGVTLAAGYSLTKDTGAPSASAPGKGVGWFHLDATTVISELPVTYQSPSARLSVSLNGNLVWHFGWQYYGYAERFAGVRGYRSHVGYSSLEVGF